MVLVQHFSSADLKSSALFLGQVEKLRHREAKCLVQSRPVADPRIEQRPSEPWSDALSITLHSPTFCISVAWFILQCLIAHFTQCWKGSFKCVS